MTPQRISRFANPSVYTAPKERSTPPRTIPIWFVRLCALLLILGAGVYTIFFSPLFSIRRVIVEGTQNQEIIARMNAFAGKNIFRVRSSTVTQGLVRDFTEVSTVHIARGIPDTIKVSVQERSVNLVWIGAHQYALLDNTGTTSKVLPIDAERTDEDVKNFKVLPFSLPESLGNVSVVWDTRGVPLDPKTFHLPTGFVRFITEGQQKLQENNVTIRYFLIRETTFQAEAVTDRGFHILFDTTRSLLQQIEAVKVVLRDHGNDVHEYIDVRVDGWGYYK